jgi:SAM-dependent methyltransferase
MTVRDTLRRGRTRARAFAQSLGSLMFGFPFIRRFRGLRLRRLKPLANGRQRGEAVVRRYWERFLEEHRADIRGRCLEIGSQLTIRRMGGSAVTACDAIDLAPHNPEITIVADLSRADALAENLYDCFINPFTMHLIYDVEAALYHSLRVLKPGGILLVNFPCVDYYFPRGLDMGTGRPLFMFWWFTPIHVENLLRRAGLGGADFRIRIDGNLFARVAYQMNMPAEELSAAELNHVDEGHPLLISVRVVKPSGWRATRPAYKDPWLPDVAPARWTPEMGHYPPD